MTPPNVVLITVDSLRADEVGFLNGEIDGTPNLDTIAQKATIASPATTPSTHTRVSVPAILTSRYAHNFFDNFFGETSIPHLGQLLSDRGYETAAFHSNPLLSESFGYNRGFDKFFDSMDEVSFSSELLTRTYSKIKRLLTRYPYAPADDINDQAIEWLSTTTEPYFLWVHYMDPHGPYTLNRELGYLDKFNSERLWRKAVQSPSKVTPNERSQLRAAYREEIAYTDQEVGDLLDAIDDETIIVLTGDHGEEFYEHGDYTHTKKLYDELIQVPFILDAPDVEQRDPDLVSLLDIVPTILEALDFDSPDELVGQNLLENEERKYVITETNTEDVSVAARTSAYKLIVEDDRMEFYDLEADPDEQSDRSSDGLPAQSRLEQVLDEFFEENTIGYHGGDEEYGDITAHTQDRLRDLGYLD